MRSIADDLVIQTFAETEIELRERLATVEREADWGVLIAKVAVEDLHVLQKRYASLQRQLQAVKDEYQAHRERTMRKSLSLSESELRPARTYTAKRGTDRRPVSRRTTTQYVPVNLGKSDPRQGADA
jgi:hypothetical protein